MLADFSPHRRKHRTKLWCTHRKSGCPIRDSNSGPLEESLQTIQPNQRTPTVLLDRSNLYYKLVIHVESFGVVLAINRLHHPSLFFGFFCSSYCPTSHCAELPCYTIQHRQSVFSKPIVLSSFAGTLFCCVAGSAFLTRSYYCETFDCGSGTQSIIRLEATTFSDGEFRS